MHTTGFSDKQKHAPIANTSVQYLVLPSESKAVTAANRGLFGFHNRYITKYRMMRAFRKLRRENA
jgi:hypothetical protein